MPEIRQTPEFSKWMRKLADPSARGRILARIDRLRTGNAGDAKPVGQSVRELRIDYGPGYRVYYVQRGDVLVVLLCGGDKRTQQADIKRAEALEKELED